VTAASWKWEKRRGPAEMLHDTTPPLQHRPTAWVLEVDEPSLVLGSGQRSDDIDLTHAAAIGLQVVKRRSGGAAVLLVPGDHVWIDVWVPSGTRWWDDDVVQAVDWLADAWVDALGTLGVEDLEVHRGAMQRRRWSGVVCFAGLGPGELSAAGRKLVGVSQRRTRDWTRFQCVVHRRWDAATMCAVLADPEARSAAGDWRDGVAVVGDREIESAFAEALARA
jgi:lipoate---protein ligase